MKSRASRFLFTWLPVPVAAVFTLSSAWANGTEDNGTGARSAGKAGASVADIADPFASMALNPAQLGYVTNPDVALSVTGAYVDGNFTSALGTKGSIEQQYGVMGAVVVRIPVHERIGVGISVIPDTTRVADWKYADDPGGIDGGTSYNQKTHRSEIIAVRSAIGLGAKISEKLSIGASVGAVYNRNQLDTPYILQSHPALAGFKTLFDLETDGWGMNADLGLTYEITEKMVFGLSYRTPTQIDAEGRVHGDVGKQLHNLGLNVPGGFRYDATVENELPQSITAGLGVKVTPKTQVHFQVDWINWSDSFDELPVRLTNGSNGAINGVLGTDRLDDTVPLNWEDRVVYRLGVEQQLTDTLVLRGGYAYGNSPVPDSTVLPMTASISEHTLSAGVGWASGPWFFDAAYQYDLPAKQSADNSIISSEYQGSEVEVSTHWLTFSTGFHF